MFGLFWRNTLKRKKLEEKPESVPIVEPSASTNLRSSSEELATDKAEERALTPDKRRKERLKRVEFHQVH